MKFFKFIRSQQENPAINGGDEQMSRFSIPSHALRMLRRMPSEAKHNHNIPWLLSRGGSRLILIILLAVYCTAASAADSPRELLGSLSDAIGMFRADEVSSGYKNAYRRYRSKDIHINIELHEVLIPLTDGYESEELQEIRQVHLNNVKDTTINVGYDGEKELDLGSGKKIKLVFVRLLSSDYSKIMADLYLTGIKGYICKIWVTRFGLVVGQKEKRVDQALRVIFSELTE